MLDEIKRRSQGIFDVRDIEFQHLFLQHAYPQVRNTSEGNLHLSPINSSSERIQNMVEYAKEIEDERIKNMVENQYSEDITPLNLQEQSINSSFLRIQNMVEYAKEIEDERIKNMVENQYSEEDITPLNLQEQSINSSLNLSRYIYTNA